MDGANGWTIVAVPSKDDYIWNLSSEKIPHMTLLFLGEQPSETPPEEIVSFLDHITTNTMTKFGLSVARRGTLGPSQADVLFFDKGFVSQIAEMRSYMLKNDAIKRLYDSTEQYPQWTPHLTMGYPETPAHKDTREYPGTTWVNFDKLFFWTGDFSGVEFDLPDNHDMEVSMSSLAHKSFSTDKRNKLSKVGVAMPDGSFPIESAKDLTNAIGLAGNSKNPTAARRHIIKRAKALKLESKIPDTWKVDGTLAHEDLDAVLAHHGIKGMKWGVRRTPSQLRSAHQEKKATKEADRGRETSAEARKTSETVRVSRNAGTSKLSNKELQDAITRMNLEQQYNRLRPKTKSEKLKKSVREILSNTAKQEAQKAVNEQVGTAIKNAKEKQRTN